MGLVSITRGIVARGPNEISKLFKIVTRPMRASIIPKRNPATKLKDLNNNYLKSILFNVIVFHTNAISWAISKR